MSKSDFETVAIVTGIGIGIYFLWSISNAASAAGTAAETNLDNFEDNVGLTPLSTWISNLFKPSTP